MTKVVSWLNKFYTETGLMSKKVNFQLADLFVCLCKVYNLCSASLTPLPTSWSHLIPWDYEPELRGGRGTCQINGVLWPSRVLNARLCGRLGASLGFWWGPGGVSMRFLNAVLCSIGLGDDEVSGGVIVQM